MIREARLTDMDAIMQVFSAAKRITNLIKSKGKGTKNRIIIVTFAL